MSRSQHQRARSAPPLATGLVAVLLLLLCSEAVHVAHAFAFVPVLKSFAVAETTASKTQARLTCQEGGGYVAAEPTAALHTSVVETVRGAGAKDTWYAFLGADTTANPTINCPSAITESAAGGVSYGCYWRWNQGRWTEMQDDTSLALYLSGVGVTFFVGNTWRTPTSAAVTKYGQTGGFPTYFDETAAANRNKRPGMYFGQQLLAVGASDTATWSDNLATGGYSYAGYSYSSVVGVSVWNTASQEATKPYFWAVCQAQAPSRTMYEMTNTSSGLQENWWIIFFVILFVVTLIAFLVVALCQDDEDMDEPPEDAPEWAQQETVATKRTKSFVSTRSFHGNTYEDEDDVAEERRGRQGARTGNGGGARRGSASSDASSRASSRGSSEEGRFRGRRRSSDTDNAYPQHEQPQYQQPPQRQPPSNAGSTRHLGRQNGSSYNMQQPQPAQYSQNGYVDNGNMNQPQNGWM